MCVGIGFWLLSFFWEVGGGGGGGGVCLFACFLAVVF